MTRISERLYGRLRRGADLVAPLSFDKERNVKNNWLEMSTVG